MPKILIIDDDKLVRESTQILLRSKGYDVVVAPDGKAGLEQAQSATFDLAIVDLFMPGMDGLQVIKALHESRPDLPLIAASGFMFSSDSGRPDMPEFENIHRLPAIRPGAMEVGRFQSAHASSPLG